MNLLKFTKMQKSDFPCRLDFRIPRLSYFILAFHRISTLSEGCCSKFTAAFGESFKREHAVELVGRDLSEPQSNASQTSSKEKMKLRDSIVARLLARSSGWRSQRNEIASTTGQRIARSSLNSAWARLTTWHERTQGGTNGQPLLLRFPDLKH